jgi:hypothetical protein
MTPGKVVSMKIPEAEGLFSDLENKLLRSRLIHLECQVSSTGANVVDFSGQVDIKKNRVVELSFFGRFDGRQTDPILNSDGRRLSGGSTKEQFDLPAEPALAEALIIGFTRMGILHNLASFSSGAMPEKAGGGARDWVEVGEFRTEESEELESELTLPYLFP